MALNVAWVFWIGRSLPPEHCEYGQHLVFTTQNIIQPVMNAFSPFAKQVFYTKVISPIALWGGGAIFMLVFVAIRKNIASLLILVSSLGYLFTVFAFLHKGDYRHHGFILLSVIFVLWISLVPSVRKALPSQLLSSRAKAVTSSLIGLFLLLGLQNVYFVYLQEYFLPFSGAKAMATAIQILQRELDIFGKGYVVVAKHKRSSAVMPYLPGVRFWNPCVEDYAAYDINNKAIAACDDMPLYDVVEKTKGYFHNLDKVLLLLETPLPIEEDSVYKYQKVYGAGERAFGYMKESFYLYQPQRKVSSAR